MTTDTEELLPVDAPRSVSVLVSVPVTCREFDVVKSAALPPELSFALAVADSLTETVTAADAVSLRIWVTEVTLAVPSPVTPGPDEGSFTGVVDEILALVVISFVLRVDSLSSPCVSSTELKADGDPVEVVKVAVNSPAPVEPNVVMVPGKPSVLSVSVPPPSVVS